MAEELTAASSFMNELMKISSDIVWKDEYTANLYETRSIMSEVALYMAAKDGELNFTVIPSFDLEVLDKVGISAEDKLYCFYDKYKIPTKYRNECVRLQSEIILASYEEKNNYYRMLSGLPDMEDTEYLYNTKYPDISDAETPVHELSLVAIYALESYGYFDELLKENPSKKYLYYIGKRRIEPYHARTAERFALLYMPSSNFVRINTDFRDLYAVCRYAILRSVYSGDRRKENEYYDSFMAMLIMFMTIQQMLARYLDADTDRDFYDYESIKYVYDHYGVPFYPDIPLDYHIKIIKNINILLKYKGSTTVFYKLFDIFNFGTMEVFDFYIMKTHKFENGRPVFKYKEDGSEDLRAMYDIKFGQVELYNNPPLELSNPDNIVEYSEITEFDPYWINDSELLDKLYNMDFNYIESKYVGFSAVFDLMAITYESAVFFKLMFDNRDKLETFFIYFSAISRNITMYDMIIYTCALICKRYGYDIALNRPSLYIAGILGFNLKADLATIIEDIKKNPTINDDKELVELLMNTNINTLSDITKVFENVQALRKHLVLGKAYAKTKEEFQAYSQLEKLLMTSEMMEEAFLEDCKLEFDPDNDATWYGFDELLASVNMILWQRLQDMSSQGDTSNMDLEIQTMLVLIRQTVTSLKYIEMCCSNGIEALLDHLFKLLDFFKSAKAELTGFQVSYNLGKRGEAQIKLFEQTMLIQNEIKTILPSWINKLTFDYIIAFHEFMKYSFNMWWDDNCNWDWSHVYINVLFPLALRFKYLKTVIMEHRFDMDIHDILHRIHTSQQFRDSFHMEDEMSLLYEKIFFDLVEVIINDGFEELTDRMIKCATIYRYHEDINVPILDEVKWNFEILTKKYTITHKIEEILHQYTLDDLIKNGFKVKIDYSAIDLAGDFGYLISNFGNVLIRFIDHIKIEQIEMKDKIINDITYLLKHTLGIYCMWNRASMYFITDDLNMIYSNTYLDALISFALVHHHQLDIIYGERSSYLELHDLIDRHITYTKIEDIISMDDKEDLNLIYEKLYFDLIDYLINDQFNILTSDVEKHIMVQLTTNVIVREFFADIHLDQLKGWYESKNLRILIDQILQQNSIVKVVDGTYTFDSDFSNIDCVDIVGELGASMLKWYADIWVYHPTMAENIKGYFTMLMSRITILYHFLIDEPEVFKMKIEPEFHNIQMGVLLNIILKCHLLQTRNIPIHRMYHYLDDLCKLLETHQNFEGEMNIFDGEELLEYKLIYDILGFVINKEFNGISVAIIKNSSICKDINKWFITHIFEHVGSRIEQIFIVKDSVKFLFDQIFTETNILHYIEDNDLFKFEYTNIDLYGSYPYLISTLTQSILKWYLRFRDSNNLIISKMRVNITHLFDHILREINRWISVKLTYGDDIDAIQLHVPRVKAFITTLFKFKFVESVIYEHRFEEVLQDECRQMNEGKFIKDSLSMDDEMELIYEKIFRELIEYLLNDQFDIITDKLMNYIYINRYNKLDISPVDILEWDESYSSFNIEAMPYFLHHLLVDDPKYLLKDNQPYIFDGKNDNNKVYENQSRPLSLEFIARDTNNIFYKYLNPFKIVYKPIQLEQSLKIDAGFKTALILEYERIIKD